MVTCGQIAFTRLCLATVLHHTPDAEIIVVDNASADGTDSYLSHLRSCDARVGVILNDRNAGFAVATNQGLAVARGEFLILLNNDTLVPQGWLDRLLGHLEAGDVGAVGPVTNRIGNEAEVEVKCDTYGDFVQSARGRAQSFAGASFDIPTLTMFCLAMRRDVFEKIGPLDERYERGMLEDDDYSRRLRQAGLRLLCAEDVLIHHFGQASFGSLVPTGEYAALLARNQSLFEEKWGEPWKPYARRRDPSYDEDVLRLGELVEATVPPGARVLVVSRGDDALLALGQREALHFPHHENGAYAGHHPADGAAALALLNADRQDGANFLVVPAVSEWWLAYYEDFGRFLNDECELVAGESAGAIFRLPSP